ncbi:MAG TPA: M20/M25/M40 family metallo-hydrolase [Thermoanaerobaculia bacterium]|nr:M20/M25/M40 family metallo-hydrolase [Thermoanaerobaculia bacterium]
MRLFRVAAALCLVVPAVAPAQAPPSPFGPAETAAAARIGADELRGTVRFLADDLLEGRGPGSRGDAVARLYLATELEKMGFLPGASEGGFHQPVDLVGTTVRPSGPVTAARGGSTLEFAPLTDVVATTQLEAPSVSIDGKEVVFVGYGIVAPEYQWDDYKGADLRGKVLLFMHNDPEDDPAPFRGQTRLYYGRWDYKYQMAAKHGAAGAIVLHTTPSAGYPWQVVRTSWGNENFSLPGEGEHDVPVRMWMTEEATKRLAALGGRDLDALVASAKKRDFRPVPLGVTLSLSLTNAVRRVVSGNVIGKLPGSDPALSREAVLFTSHHDHFGRKAGAGPDGRDAIFHGALDNASGVASVLALARAIASMPERPRRTLYVAFVAGEEQGLLGSRYLAAHLPLPAGRIAANVNVDGASIWGRTRDVSQVGMGKSGLDAWARDVAAAQGRVVVPEPFPDRGSFYRSDQFSFAKIGIPAAYFGAGVDVVGKGPAWGREQHEAFELTNYHQPSDALTAAWNFDGYVEDTRFLFHFGLRVANAPEMPAWNPGDEFEAVRKASLAAVP